MGLAHLTIAHPTMREFLTNIVEFGVSIESDTAVRLLPVHVGWVEHSHRVAKGGDHDHPRIPTLSSCPLEAGEELQGQQEVAKMVHLRHVRIM